MSRVLVVAGLGLGDEGKGSMVDFLCRNQKASAVVRYNGGPQAAHHVVLENNLFHCFSQFGSGTFVPGVRTHLSRQMLVKPGNLMVERDVLAGKGEKDALERLSVDPSAAVVTPWHGLLCQLAETARGKKRFGSVGMGVGEAAADRRNDPAHLVVSDFLYQKSLESKLERHYRVKMRRARELASEGKDGKAILERHCRENPPEKVVDFYREFGRRCSERFVKDEIFFSQIPDNETVIFEGAQGMLLDYQYGFAPYVTKTDVSFRAAGGLLEKTGRKDRKVVKIGVLRAYSTRHGAGPFVTDEPALYGSLKEAHNDTNAWQGEFKVGWFDLLTARYALSVCGEADCLAFTCLDRLSGLPQVKVCMAYRFEGDDENLGDFFECEKEANEILITGIKPQQSAQHREKLSKLLLKCRPALFREFSGWDNCSSSTGLPSSLVSYLAFLESPDGLNKPVALISLGPKAEDKMMLRRDLIQAENN